MYCVEYLKSDMKQTLIVYTDKQHKTMLTLMLNRNKLCFEPLPSFGMS